MPSANALSIGLEKQELETPALCLDLDIYQRNAARMADFIIRRCQLNWRPHMKGQKAVELGRLAIDAGAIGVTCATVYEAEAMVDAGVNNILLANQVVGERKAQRLARLQNKATVIAATDSSAHLAILARAAQAVGVTIPVIVEIDVGMGRCGIAPGEPAVALAREAAATPGILLRGLMGWEGHILKYDPEEKVRQSQQSMTLLIDTANAFRQAGLSTEIVSAAGSGTFQVSAPIAGLTEIQAGGGVFSDLSYQKWGLEHEFALTIVTRVVSRPNPTRAIVDGGFKTMSFCHGFPSPIGVEGVQSVVLSAEHGTLEFTQPNDTLRVGDTVEFIPGYTDSTVCLHDEMVVLRNGVVEAAWVIPGRSGRR
jgi:D-serine deaminase-like pyridoxal phosphate-dependent protein